jgi:glycosyltransferase involved in cell wall biosynthesis
MPRFTKLIAEGMKRRGHEVEIWLPESKFFSLPLGLKVKKWLGYIDQYIIFPIQVAQRLKSCPSNTLFVFADQALGPWVPLVANRPHVIHCHDFLAQRSALGDIPQNKTGRTGKQYQAYIRRGYSTGKHFISVSHKTRENLHRFLPSTPLTSEVVYNGLNQTFTCIEPLEARIRLSDEVSLTLHSGFILHVGGNDWYKNRKGVIEIYSAWRSLSNYKLPLLLIGNRPSQTLLELHELSPYKNDIYFLSGLKDEVVRLAYAAASLLLFPSLAEGFGWPIAEAMASGCPVITTNEAPMSEVAGNAGFLISKRPVDEKRVEAWAIEAAKVVEEIVSLPTESRKDVIEAGILNAKRFDTEDALNKIEAIYRKICVANQAPERVN